MSGQYTVYHLHSDLSNGVTNIDSVTKYGEYIVKAKECGMNAMGFSEHGSVFEWWHKKSAIEAAGMKYIHAVECYLTTTLTEKIRDNYHCVLLAKNYSGFLELNRLVSNSFCRKDNHFYYAPRITFDELFHTSDNILVTTACVGGVLGKGDEQVQRVYLDFLTRNRHRCFLEVGHHMDEKQISYNKKLLALSQELTVPLIAGTDTHVLNEEHEKGRSILQASKNIFFDGEERWDLKFKTYDELVAAYRAQGSLPEAEYMQAIENTNLLANMVEPFELDRGTKYPHIYAEPEKTFREKVQSAMETHPYALKNHTKEELERVVEEEFDVYKATKSIDFMLLQTYLREWENENGIQCGYGRGSVSGSMIAYLLGITQMDSLRFGLNFFRFMNPSRVTNADIDTDYSGKDRDTVKRFLLRDKMNLPSIRSAEIITFNTIALKGAVRDVCRALYKDRQDINYIQVSNHICKEVETHEEAVRKKYPEVFRYVDIVNGTIVSIGTHPSGVLISDLPIEQTVGLCSVSTSEYPVSMINMKELDDLMYVKLDILGLDNIGVINETCKTLGIERLTPDNTDMEDMSVWKSIRDDTTLIFQWESDSAQHYLRQFMSDNTLETARSKIPNFSMLKWMSFGNGLLRPACASFRDSVAKGEFYDNGFDALNEFLSPEAGRIAMQETIMQFLVKFCGYSAAESDNVRRAIAKKKGTETLLPEIEERFVAYISQFIGTNGAYLYTGNKAAKRKSISLDGHVLVLAPHAGCIDADTWIRCRRKCLNVRQIAKPVKAKNTWLAGKIKCIDCGHALSLKSYPRKRSADARYYICNSKYVSASCDGVGAIQASGIEDIVFDEMSRKLKEFNKLSYKEKHGDPIELTKLKIRAEEIEKEIATLIDKIVSASTATMEYINERIDALDEEKKTVKEKIAQMSAEMYDRQNIGVISDYMSKWNDISIDDKLTVVDTLIESIHVGHGKVKIAWKI